jgi:hypothetical protein
MLQNSLFLTALIVFTLLDGPGFAQGGSGAAPGTNSAGTAQSSGKGSGGSSLRSQDMKATDLKPENKFDDMVERENREMKRKIGSICKGC